MFWDLIDRMRMGWWTLGVIRWVLVALAAIGISALVFFAGFRATSAPLSSSPRTTIAPAGSGTRRVSIAGCATAQQKLRSLDASYPTAAERPPSALAEARTLAQKASATCPTVQENFVKNVLLKGWSLGG